MVSNLIASSGDIEPIDESIWFKEYSTGKGHEIYRVEIVKSKYPEISFAKLAEVSYSEYSAIVFALEIQSRAHPEKSMIRLNPAHFMFQKSDFEHYDFHLYIICEDGDIAQEISELEMPSEKFEKCFGKQREVQDESISAVDGGDKGNLKMNADLSAQMDPVADGSV